MTSDIISRIFTTTLIFQYLLGLTMLKTTLLSAIFILSGYCQRLDQRRRWHYAGKR